MFNKDFYPTPESIINKMLIGVDVAGKTILEPSGGKGNIVDILIERAASEVLSFEKEQVLADHLMKKCSFLGYDFMECTAEEVSHIDLIIMNPPFSRDEQHILHAWKVAPDGCHIISLCPDTTLDGYSREQRRLQHLIDSNGNADIQLGDCFSNAERKTNVDVSVVHLFKPVAGDAFDFSGFFMDPEEQRDHPEGVIKHNEVRSLVGRYVGAMKCFDKMYRAKKELEELISPIGLSDNVAIEIGYNNSVSTKADFGKVVQKAAWKYIFGEMNLGRFVTSGVMENINRFVEKQTKYPFTMKNIYRMFEIIIGTRDQMMNKALEEAFDQVTKHYDKNRYHVEGWKTNSHYMVKQYLIVPHMVEEAFRGGGLKFRVSSYSTKIDDLNKALCWLTGRRNDLKSIQYLRESLPDKRMEWGTWYDWGFFEVKGFYKGTLHLKFKDDKVWELFNRRVAEIKGHPLPEKV